MTFFKEKLEISAFIHLQGEIELRITNKKEEVEKIQYQHIYFLN